MTVITVFGRHGCHLCDVAVEVLEGMRNELNFEIEKIYIEGNTELEKLYYRKNKLNINESNIEFEDEPFCASFKWFNFVDLPSDYLVLQSRIRTRLQFSSACLIEMHKYRVMKPKLCYLSKLKTKWNFSCSRFWRTRN